MVGGRVAREGDRVGVGLWEGLEQWDNHIGHEQWMRSWIINDIYCSIVRSIIESIILLFYCPLVSTTMVLLFYFSIVLLFRRQWFYCSIVLLFYCSIVLDNNGLLCYRFIALLFQTQWFYCSLLLLFKNNLLFYCSIV